MSIERALPVRRWLPALLAGLVAVAGQAAERLVVLTSDVAEIVVALGKAAEVVGRDRASKQPELAKAGEIGSSRSLSAEPIVRLKPTLVIGSQLATPDGIWGQLGGLGIRAVKIGARENGSDYADMIRSVGKLIGAESDAGKLAGEWQAAMQSSAAAASAAAAARKRVLITYEGKTVAGRDTPGDALIRAAGGINAAAGVDGYKPLDPEAIARLAPDLILVADHNRAVYGGLDGFKRRPDIAATPAGRNGKVFEVPVHEFFTINLGSPASVKKLRELS
ncbi:heme/hemin ABC transporter substrate-binding protein [Chitinimonas koreensis]|uniref:heme/hemin ABC transporter substrate-binding protein n=1 Tax=Chitinimonas koreensis TaxID=356302 RepID=UPI00040E5BE8|nr:ABC transporter substrate-binding protein [Chitinimonas koreensis]QNM98315.1 ABC transporter substrate-binding protein [Chitinimonas koreensis]